MAGLHIIIECSLPYNSHSSITKYKKKDTGRMLLPMSLDVSTPSGNLIDLVTAPFRAVCTRCHKERCHRPEGEGNLQCRVGDVPLHRETSCFASYCSSSRSPPLRFGLCPLPEPYHVRCRTSPHLYRAFTFDATRLLFCYLNVVSGIRLRKTSYPTRNSDDCRIITISLQFCNKSFRTMSDQ
jgi:hypothetical protein